MSQLWNLFHKSQDSNQFDRAFADDDSITNSSVRTLNGCLNQQTSNDDLREVESKKKKKNINKDLNINTKRQKATAEVDTELQDEEEEEEEEDKDLTITPAKFDKECKADQFNDETSNPFNYNSNVSYTPNHKNNGNCNNDKVFSPISSNSSSSMIFERNVQDQGTLPNCLSRRNSALNSPQLAQHHRGSFASTHIPHLELQRTQSASARLHNHHKGSICPNCLNGNGIPDHLNSEAFIPCVLDASTEIFHDKDINLENVEVIKSVNSSIFQNYLDSKNHPVAKHNQSLPVSRRESSISPIDETKRNQDIDYSNHMNKNQLNFCSFIDIINDEIEQQQQQNLDHEIEEQHPLRINMPLKRRNSSILILPALSHFGSSTNVRPLSSTTVMTNAE